MDSETPVQCSTGGTSAELGEVKSRAHTKVPCCLCRDPVAISQTLLIKRHAGLSESIETQQSAVLWTISDGPQVWSHQTPNEACTHIQAAARTEPVARLLSSCR